ncbi:platelet-activating factor acetylhydrolase IB subunit alpha2 [Pyrgilauda ruficollis]|uniref:platelet-activating factor acetylhydrolase IB subunit alpha2 n=1 Tax=Pyrgilauda ruficollis TaxID=221976 RepID=UPI001B872C34|nr:platelet-activating factor acetylhydrolase IB subunit alpha2 [Pyrgilauda ruficollis]
MPAAESLWHGATSVLPFSGSCQHAQEQAGVVCSGFQQPFASPAAVGAAGAVGVTCSSHRNRMGMGDSNPAAVPHAAEDIQGDDRWMSQHNRFVLDCKDKEPDVLFVGDSMVQLLQQYEIWRELFSPLHALNFGIGGDTTGHVLWRLKNGELENIKPKVIVVWVGTNNHENTAEEVAGGIEAIVRLINTQQPQAKVIVLGLLPRGEKPNPLRQKNAKVNHLLKASLPKLPNVQLLDVDVGFVHSDGTISYHDMFDFLHLTGGGYAKVCKPLHELIMQLLEETPEEKRAALA